MKPPGAPEVPIDARKRKGLIGTEVRGEKMRGPGARCVVQFLEKRVLSKGVRFRNQLHPDPPGQSIEKQVN